MKDQEVPVNSYVEPAAG